MEHKSTCSSSTARDLSELGLLIGAPKVRRQEQATLESHAKISYLGCRETLG